jgi:formaldehyde-activating enzyme involved in methanogenesis
LRSVYHDSYESFTAAIEQCLAELPTKHKAAMDALLTHNFQTFENVSVVTA